MPALVLLSVTWFLLLAGMGAWTPYYALHLQRGGMSPAAIGLLLALIPAGRIVATPIWAWIGDRSGQTTRVLQAAALVSAAGAALTLVSPHPVVLVVGLAVFAMARGPVGPLMDAQAVGLLEARTGSAAGYGRLRLWGSLGFLVAGFYAGTRADADSELPVRLAVLAWTIGGVLTLWFPPAAKHGPVAVLPAVRVLLRERWCRLVLGASVLHGAGLTGYDMFYGLLVRERGLASTWTGAAVVSGVLAEMLVLAMAPWLLRRWGAERLVLGSMVVGAARWAGTAVLTDPWALTALQASHGVVFAAFWAGGVEWMRREAGPTIRASSQAVFTVAGYGVGNLLAGLLGSLVIGPGGMTTYFVVCTGLSLVAAGMVRAAMPARVAVA